MCYAHLMKRVNQESVCGLEKTIFQNSSSKMVAEKKKGYSVNRNLLIFMVGTIGFEPTTSTVSR